jgi:cell wall-active antibiotic response 4TMS protein YvqF/B-box zinc finger protein
MNCANHSDTAAVAFCRTCGKPLCQNCTRDVRGVIYCETCLAARMEGVTPAAGYTPVPPTPPQTPYQQIMDQGLGLKVGPGPSSGPNPVLAGLLSLFPGVGAVYSGQYVKGLAHLVIFVLLVICASESKSDAVGTLLGFLAAFFFVYQIIDAVRSAKAIQVGEPSPDPFGLAQTFSGETKFDTSKVPVGSVILIGLGVLFLLHTMKILEFGFERFWPLIIVFLGGWMFYRHWERTEKTCTCGRCRTRWLMGPSMVLTTGLLLLLQSTDIADLGRTWPAWLLVVGVVKLLQSSASSEGHVGPLPPGPASIPPPPPQAPPPGTTESNPGEVNHV